MKRLVLISFCCLAIFGMTSCDRVTDPFEGIAQSGGDLVGDTSFANTGNVRKVLAEEFTGHTCQSCPRWSESLNDWAVNRYNKNVVVAAMHFGPFAEPNVSKGYPTDFRNETSQLVHDSRGVTLYPTCAFSRLSQGAASPGTWETILEDLNNSGYFNNPTLKLTLRNIRNDTEDKNNISITGEALSDITGEHTVIVYIVEDSIIAPQTDQRREIQGMDARDPEYPHRHVVRGHIGSVSGNAFIPTEGLTTGETVEVNYDLGADDRSDDWDVKHLIFVAAVVENSTGKIIQTEEIHAVASH